MSEHSLKQGDELLAQTARAAKRFSGCRPYTILCYAQSLDGSIGTQDRKPIALSCSESLRFTHQLRAMCDGILIGIGTVLSDDPQLTTRLVAGDNPQPIVLDSQLRIPLTAGLFQGTGKMPWIIASSQACEQKAKAIQRIGGRVIKARMLNKNLLDLNTLLPQLKENGIQRLMVEGGQQIISSFLRSKIIDELIVTIAPIFVGGLRVISEEEQHVYDMLTIKERAQVGRDLVLRLLPEVKEK